MAGNSKVIRYNPGGFIPNKKDNPDNWLMVERSHNRQLPVCTGATGNPGTIANTGLFVSVIWTQKGSIYDPFNMVGPTPTEQVRIPLDGFYSFYLHWFSNDNPGGQVNCDVACQLALTSDTGFGAPVWTNPITNYRQSIQFNAAATFDHGQFNLFRGVELHANDLVRFRIRQDGGTNLTTTTVITSEFLFLYPIPNQNPL